MAKIIIEINTDNAAFNDEDDYCTDFVKSHEVARILYKLQHEICDSFCHQVLFDINGNKVGEFNIIKD